MKCAYCDADRKLSREHIIPKCFYKKNKGHNAGLSVVAHKIHRAEHQVRDVCIPCNSKILSQLDAYASKLYDLYFSKIVENEINFEYDSDLLTRWLLKVSYNAARASGVQFELMKQFKNYVLKGGAYPDNLRVHIYLIGVTRQNHRPNLASEVPPDDFRIGTASTSGFEGVQGVRFVCAKSYMFKICVGDQSGQDLIGKHLAEHYSACTLNINTTNIVIPQSSIDYVQSKEATIIAYRSIYEQYFSNITTSIRN